MVTTTKFSAIVAAGAISGTDQILGVQAGPTDVLYTVTNMAAAILGAGKGVTAASVLTSGRLPMGDGARGIADSTVATIGTSLAINGATIGGNALAVAGTVVVNGNNGGGSIPTKNYAAQFTSGAALYDVGLLLTRNGDSAYSALDVFSNSLTNSGQIARFYAISNPLSITTGSYDNSTGIVTMVAASSDARSGVNQTVFVKSLTGTGAFASLNGTFLTIAGTTGATIKYNAGAGLGASTITGGTVGHKSLSSYVAGNGQWYGGYGVFSGLYGANPYTDDANITATPDSTNLSCNADVAGPCLQVAGNLLSNSYVASWLARQNDNVTYKYVGGVEIDGSLTFGAGTTRASMDMRLKRVNSTSLAVRNFADNADGDLSVGALTMSSTGVYAGGNRYQNGVGGTTGVLIDGLTPRVTIASNGYFGASNNIDILSGSTDVFMSRLGVGNYQIGTGANDALGSLNLANLTGTGTIIIGTGDAASSTGGALRVTGGASVAKRFWLPAITASAGLQTAVLCQSSGGEVIADSVACLASSARFKTLLGNAENGALDKIIRVPIHKWKYNRDPGSVFPDNYYSEHIGPTAEEIEAIDSRLVGRDQEGKARSISTDQLLALAIQAIQEQQEQIEVLREKLE